MMEANPRRDFLKGLAGGLLVQPLLISFLRADGKKDKPIFPFYAMDTGLVGNDVPSLESRVKLLKKLGYDGIGYTPNNQDLPRLLELLDSANLHLSALYTTPQLEGDADSRLKEWIQRLKGRSTRIELAISSNRLPPSDPKGDPRATDLIRKLSDWASDTGPVVSIYPHKGSWTERVEDGIRLAKSLDRKNVGTNFNLVHWKWVKQTMSLEDLLARSVPYLFSVTINGLKDDQIVSLDQGNFDLVGFMAAVKKAGYRGQVGLQGYGVPGPSADHLGRSMNRWKEIMKKI